jgi:hypothetical protein
MRRIRSLGITAAAVAATCLYCRISLRAAQAPALFSSDPQHLANRLYRLVHVRTDQHGAQHGFDSLDPLLWSQTNYLLAGKSHTQALALLDEFLRTHAERQVPGPEKRAILQRDLWAVFDWADDSEDSELPHHAERAELMARLAPAIRRLALSPDEFAALPDTYSRALANHEFPATYDPAHPNQAFLPPELFDPAGPWVCLGASGDDLAAPLHDVSFTARSVFFVFARFPAGRAATLAYFQQLADMKIPLFVKMKSPGMAQPMDVWNPQVPQFPAGTEFALVRKLLLPDRDGHLRATAITESIQIRHYTSIPRVDPLASRDVDLAKHFQDPSESELSRVLLFSPGHSGLRGVTPSDEPNFIFPAMMQGFDAFEDPHFHFRHYSPFILCTSCHLGPGIQSMMSFSFRATPDDNPGYNPRLAETTPARETEKVIAWAQTRQKWKDLLGLWASDAPN